MNKKVRENGEYYDYTKDFAALSALGKRAALENAKNLLKVQCEGENEEPCDYRKDFSLLTPVEKRIVLKTAQTLLKQQKENKALIASVPLKKGQC